MSHVCTLVKVTVPDKAQTKLSLTCLPFGEPQLIRRVVLLEAGTDRTTVRGVGTGHNRGNQMIFTYIPVATKRLAVSQSIGSLAA